MLRGDLFAILTCSLGDDETSVTWSQRQYYQSVRIILLIEEERKQKNGFVYKW